MSTQTRSIAMLAANPAFAGILCRALEQGGHKVVNFTGVETLTTFLRISPVDVVVLDTDIPGAPAIDIARGLRNHVRLASGAFELVALTRAAEAFHAPLIAAGIDVVLTKPVSPVQFLACINGLTGSRRGQAPATADHRPAAPFTRPAAPRPHISFGDVPPVARERSGNVIQLFPRPLTI
jgi:DNA-binding response OmpR family regulator